MIAQDHFNGWACIDCLMLLANDETPPEMDEGETEVWLAEIERRAEGLETTTLGRMFGEDGCEHTHDDWDASPDEHAEQCERLEFSWSRCDVCGSTLGGAREAVTFWFNPTTEATR